MGGGSVEVVEVEVGSGLILSLSATPDETQSGTSVAVRVTVKNDGTASAGSKTIRLYRHRSRTSNPTSGSRLATTVTTGSLAAGAQVTKTIIAPVPSVTTDTTYYYYACVSTADGEVATDDNCSGPAEVRVYTLVIASEPSYESCFSSAVRRTPMGGDALLNLSFDASNAGTCGTITLGGIETIDGTRGFVVAAHSLAETIRSDISSDPIDSFVGHSEDERYNLHHLLGKPLRMPSTKIEGGKKILSVDAAFVKYPNPPTPNCSLAWQRDGESFCLDDTDQADYIDRITPLTIRGRGRDTYRVVGSRRPTKGLEVTYSGATSGPSDKTGNVIGEKMLVFEKKRDLYFHS